MSCDMPLQPAARKAVCAYIEDGDSVQQTSKSVQNPEMRASLRCVALFAASAAARIYYAGVAESGGEFGVYSADAINGTGLPGRFGVDYQFINESAVDVYVEQNHVRISALAYLDIR